MKVDDYYINTIKMNGIERKDEQGNSVICKGYFCSVYDDPACGNKVDSFHLAIGYDIPDDTSDSLERGIRKRLNLDANEIDDEQQKKKNAFTENTVDSVDEDWLNERDVLNIKL